MKVPLSWLREFVDITVSASALADRLTLAGIEVEGIEERGRELDGITVCEILAIEPHPQADRLSICQVRAGEAVHSVVCGAPNVRVGARVPYAMPGARLADGQRIEAAEVRGVRSHGMLCSEAELGLGSDTSGLMLLADDAALGHPLAVHLGIADAVLAVAITPNRGDCLSVLGLAREIAALYEQTLHPPRIRVREHGTPAAARVTVRIADPLGCRRYTARVIDDVRVGPSPGWMQRRLLAAEVRPINNIVDATNYVMLERGQPLHAFDYNRLLQPQIVVRRAAAATTFATLDARDRVLDPSDLLITTGDEPVAVAGVMGGANSEVSADTRHVLLESARFDPATIRRTARRLGVRSEASYRFERGVDIEGVVPALDRAAQLIAEIAGGRVAPGIVDAYPTPRQPAAIDLRVPRIEFLLGLPVTRNEAAATMRRLGARVKVAGSTVLRVTPPSYRHDLEREIDLIEEVVRLLGYDRVPATLPAVALHAGGRTGSAAWEAELRRFLAGQGFHEMVTLSFVSPRHNQLFRGIGLPAVDSVKIRNPIVTDEPEMRRSLCPGLVQAVRANLNYDEPSVAGFTLGKVFWMTDKPMEGRRLAAVLCGPLSIAGLGGQRRAADFLDAKGALEAVLVRLRLVERVAWERAGEGFPAFHPGKSAVALIDGCAIAVVGALHPDVEEEIGLEQPCWLFELDLERALEYVPARPIFRDLPRFPAVVRDVAIVAEGDFASDQVIRFVRRWNSQVVERVSLFDQYTGPPIPVGRKSLAYSIAYRAADRTLTDDEVNQLHQQLLAALSAALPIELRR